MIESNRGAGSVQNQKGGHSPVKRHALGVKVIVSTDVILKTMRPTITQRTRPCEGYKDKRKRGRVKFPNRKM